MSTRREQVGQEPHCPILKGSQTPIAVQPADAASNSPLNTCIDKRRNPLHKKILAEDDNVREESPGVHIQCGAAHRRGQACCMAAALGFALNKTCSPALKLHLSWRNSGMAPERGARDAKPVAPKLSMRSTCPSSAQPLCLVEHFKEPHDEVLGSEHQSKPRVQGIIPPTRLAAEFHFAARSHIDDVTAKDELLVS